MDRYDVIAIGSGAGNIIASQAFAAGMSVALVDRGPLGGTCLNTGCIPSKMLIYPADRIMQIREARRLGIRATVEEIDVSAIMARMRALVEGDRESMRRGIARAEGLDYYPVEARFVDAHTLDVGDGHIRGEMIFVAAGSRPVVPPIQGLDSVDYLTNETVLELEALPESLVILGGGYIGCEYAHFFEAMGTRVTVVEMLDRLVSAEEPEVSEVLGRALSARMTVLTETRVERVEAKETGCRVHARNLSSGEHVRIDAERLMVAVGRRPNADLLNVGAAGLETDERGFVVADAYMQTSHPHIWAFGDIIGKAMFRHAANREASVAWHNATHEHKVRMDYMSVPHAVFSHPQIASVGLTEAQARAQFGVAVGHVEYPDIAKGAAMALDDGFAKVIVDRENRHILGLHVVGPFAPLLVQEAITVMANAGTIDWIARAMHIHPAASELIGDLPYVLHAHDDDITSV